MGKKSEGQENNKKNLKECFGNFKKKCFAIHLSTWYFSVAFFAVVFLVSIWIWWVSFYRPKPSQQTISTFEAGKENFEGMKSRTESAIEMLKERRGNFLNAPDFASQRDLFVDEREARAMEEKAREEQTVKEEQAKQLNPQDDLPAEITPE